MSINSNIIKPPLVVLGLEDHKYKESHYLQRRILLEVIMLFPVALEFEEKCSIGVMVPDVPGCFSAGDTVEEALVNTKEALTYHLSEIMKDGMDIPIPFRIEDHIHNEDYKGCLWSYIEIDPQRL